MESLKVTLNADNCAEHAQKLVEILRGQTFAMMPLREGTQDPEKESIKELRLYDGPAVDGFNHEAGFMFEGGKVNILLNQQKRLCWDIHQEDVEINYFDKGYITITRVTHTGTWTVMIYFK